MTIVPPGFAEVSIPFQHILLNRRAWVVFGVAVGVDPDPVAVADAVMSAWSANMAFFNDTNVTIGPAEAEVGQDGGENTTGVGTITAPGQQNYTDALNPGQAVLVRKNTTRGGRRGRGRMFIPWWVSDQDVDEVGLIQNEDLVARQTAVDDFLSGLDVGAAQPMVLLHGTGLTSPGDPDLVTGLQVDRLVGSQRRRLARRG